MKSESECPEYKHLPYDEDEHLRNPSNMRFFHERLEGDPLCCKLAWTDILDFKGWKYKRHFVLACG